MYWQHTPYTIPLLISAVFASVIGRYIYRYRTARGAVTLTLVFACVALWSLEYALELAVVGLGAKHFFANLQYISITTMPVLWLVFALQYTERNAWTRPRPIALLFSLPALTAIVAWTDYYFGLIRSQFETVYVDGAAVLSVVEYGPWFWLHTAYSYSLFLIGTLLILPFFFRAPHLYRGQLAACLIGVFAPWIANILYLFIPNPWPYLDLTPFAFIIMGLATTWGLFRFQLFDLVPTARHEVVERLRDGVAVFDTQDRLIDANPTVCTILELERGTIGLPATDALAAMSTIELPLRETTGDEVCLGPDGATRHYEVQVNELRDQSEHLSGHLLVFHDITERKRAEDELVRSQRLRAAGELSLGVSHNLNNILTGILGPAHLLKEIVTEGEAAEYVDVILRSSQRARDLVHRLRRTVEEEGADLQAVYLERAIHEAIKAAQPRWKDEPEVNGVLIEIKTHFSDAPIAAADSAGLHDILLNLFFNAVDALTTGGTITIRAQRNNEYAELIFSDSGIGMDEDTRRRVFEPFFTTKVNVGTGLGLSTAYATVQRWGGEITVESAPGKGTRFILQMPLWKGPLSQEVEAEEDIPEIADSDKTRVGRILLAEDEAIIGMLVEGRLQARGHELVYAATADEAIEQFSASRFDIAIIDLGIPGRPGDELAKLFKERDPNLRTLLVTGWDLKEDDPRRQPFDLYIKKPFNVRRIEQAVAQLLAEIENDT
jgi:signal transduction histidine kinase